MKILTHPDNIALLREAFRYVMEDYPFKIDAVVILPDHIHCILTLPYEDSNYSTRWRLVKTYFSRKCDFYQSSILSHSREKKKEKAIWQRRFWEHLIRDEKDFNAHCNYIHYNPVRHGYVNSPGDWQHSSFSQFVRDGFYEPDWGCVRDMCFDEGVGRE